MIAVQEIFFMTTVNLSLPEDIGALAEEQVAAGRFASLSEYVASLIRDDRQRLEQLAAEAKLRQRIDSGPSVEMTDDHFDRIRERLEAEITRRRSP
jgi:Arc/MetJ-type ribon-helix-helix transcriptional regulator